MDSEVSDPQLLRQYLRTRDAKLLGLLMDRHLPLVYSAALRASADPELAMEASQDVFIKLTTAPAALMKDSVPLLAWLHRTARHRALDLKRSEMARKEREKRAVEPHPDPSAGALPPEVPGMLDEVIDRLPPFEKELVLQRYFLGRSLAAIGRQKSLSEDAVRMRLKRSLEKMRALFQVRGVTTTTALLAASLPSQAISMAPSPAAAAVMKAVSGRAAGISPKISLSFLPYLMTATQKYTAGAAALLLAGIVTVSLVREPDSGGTAAGPIAGKPENGSSPELAGKDPAGQKPVRKLQDYPDLAAKYGESRTRLALHMAKDVLQLSEDTATVDRSTAFSQEQQDARSHILEEFGITLALRDDQKEALSRLLPEWGRLSSERTAQLATLAAAHPAEIAEAALAVDCWNGGKMDDEELSAILARTSQTLAAGEENVLDLLEIRDAAGPSGDPFHEFPELARQLEGILDPGQARQYRELRGNPGEKEALSVKKSALEDISRSVEARAKRTALWAEETSRAR